MDNLFFKFKILLLSLGISLAGACSTNQEQPTACDRALTVCKLDLAACQHDKGR